MRPRFAKARTTARTAAPAAAARRAARAGLPRPAIRGKLCATLRPARQAPRGAPARPANPRRPSPRMPGETAVQYDVDTLYPYIGGILKRCGSEVRLGGVIEERQTFDSQETTTYNWDYEVNHPQLRKLYERAKAAQWVSADLPWDTDVDLEADLFALDPAWASADWYRKFNEREQRRLKVEYNSNLISNFIHGEQGALTAASQLITAVPDMDGKLYAASQAFDEARHVEVFSRYVNEKLDNQYPVTQNLFNLMQAITVESRWDFKFLGMQLIVEGLAISAFMSLLNRTREPLLRELIRRVLQDEARHVAFGVISLRNFYDDMPEKERLERQQFVYEACVLMRGRLVSGDAYQRMGLDPALVRETLRQSDEARDFQRILFSQVVPAMEKVGLLNGWLEARFAEMEVLQFRDLDADAVLESLISGTNAASPQARSA
jgi:ribonucleotide reductase beta subunit family protein with ferritin-like domain